MHIHLTKCIYFVKLPSTPTSRLNLRFPQIPPHIALLKIPHSPFPLVPHTQTASFYRSNSIVNKHYNKMQTPRCEYKIASMMADRLVIARTNTNQKFIYREYKQANSPSLTSDLRTLKAIDNPNLIRVFEVIEDAGHTGVYIEHYTMDLASRIDRASLFDEDSLLNTIQPIRLAVEYLHSLERHPSDITPKNIVVTEQGDVKLIDDMLLSSQPTTLQKMYSKEGDYARLLQTTLMLIEGTSQDSTKTLKQQLKKLKPRAGREMYNFLNELYDKSRAIAPKIKKIRKKVLINNENKERSNPRGKLSKICHKTLPECKPQLMIPIKTLN